MANGSSDCDRDRERSRIHSSNISFPASISGHLEESIHCLSDLRPTLKNLAAHPVG